MSTKIVTLIDEDDNNLLPRTKIKTLFDENGNFVSNTVTAEDLNKVHENRDDWDAKYDKPSSGIPETDLASALQGKVGHGEYAYTFTEAWKKKVCGYGGVDLSTKFTLAQLRAKVQAEDFTGVDIGDYWPITLNGQFSDYGAYFVPAGTTYYSDAACTTEAGTYASNTEGYYQDDNTVIVTTGQYVPVENCTYPMVRTLSNAVMKCEVAGFNIYRNMGDTAIPAHILFFTRDGLPTTLRMRIANSKWTDMTTYNPWCGSALYKTLNDPDTGVINLVAQTDLGAYIYGGPNGKGMRFYGDTWNEARTSVSSWAAMDRGKLFLPTETEVYGRAVWQTSGYACGINHTQWPIFIGSGKHRMKGAGNGSGRTHWWLSTASSSAGFAGVSYNGYAGYDNAGDRFAVPLGFLFT